MRAKVAKRLKKEVMLKMYLGDGVTEQDLKKDKHSVFQTPEFKSVYRARKKNYNKSVQVVNHMLVNTEPDERMVKMSEVRIKKDAYRRMMIKIRKK